MSMMTLTEIDKSVKGLADLLKSQRLDMIVLVALALIQYSEDDTKERGIRQDLIDDILWQIYERIGKRLRSGKW